MLNLKSVFAATAAATLFAGAQAGEFGLIGKRTGGPAQPSCTDFTPYVYSGCFSDSGATRALLYASDLPSDTMTVNKCIAFCKGNDYEYAGLEYYGQCFCGASVIGSQQLDESQCNFPCNGNKTEACGGNSIISIYQDPTFPTVDDNDISDYQAIGCYAEGSSGRTLAWRQDDVAENTLTLETCLSACKKGGYAFAGVEYGQECYCGVVLGNGTALVEDTICNVPCKGNSAQTCGGPSALNLYVAKDLESTQPCADSPQPGSSSTVTSSTTTLSSSTTSPSSTKPTTTTTPVTSPSSTKPTTTTTPVTSPSSTKPTSSTSCKTTSTTSPPATTSPTTTKKPSSTASLCTSTYTVTPQPTCEYKCGKWCSSPLPDFSDKTSCLKAVAQCNVQLASCFLKAGFPASLDCFNFGTWCKGVSQYCGNSCPGKSCSVGGCKKKNPPAAPEVPKPTVTSSVYSCVSSKPTVPTSTPKPVTSSTTSSCVPVPTQNNVCKQPHNPSKGYSIDSPVGEIELPCLTCNNLLADFNRGFQFKLYTDPETKNCKSYGRGGSKGPVQACKDACDAQHDACQETYANGCKNNNKLKNKNKFKRGRYDGGDNYDKASTKCKNQRDDCYSTNSKVTGSSRCTRFDSGW